MTPFQPTPYPLVNGLLQSLRDGIQAILGEQLVGLYLYGSLALGDFDPRKSDIDFLAATRAELRGEPLAALQVFHRHFAQGSSPWADELEGSYIPLAALRRYDPADTHHPHLDRGSGGALSVEQHDTDWIVQRYSLREYGVTLLGPAPRALIDPISPDELRQAVRDLLWWWQLQLRDTSRVQTPGYQAYAVLSMCRIRYTLREGCILSKPQAARWAQQFLGQPYAVLIERALAWQPGQSLDCLPETLDFIRDTLREAKHI